MSSDTSGIRTLVDAFADAFNRKDPRAFGALFADDAEFVNIFGAWWRGKRAIEDNHGKVFASMLAQSKLVIVAVEPKVLAPGLALAMVRWHRDALPDAEGRTLPPGDGVLSMLARRDGDGWSFVLVHNTAVAAPPGR